MFKKLLIANRGEIACRIIKTAKKMQIATVAVYSEIDAAALHVQLADESVCIGPAASSASYLDKDKIIRAALSCGAQAIHPGYGFLSEDAQFAQQCEDAGIIFVGPPASAIRIMGDKNLAKVTMSQAGVPVTPGYQEDQINLDAIKKVINKIGLPVLIKASAGGGGKGMRLVENLSQLEDALQSASREAEASFGDSRVFVEKYLPHARHIEVQILFDQYGKGIYLFDRDCSVQRRHQKVIEEAPAPNLQSSTRQKMANTALRAGAAIQYTSAGTIEFLVDQQENFYFMEMNTRLQVEHPVTEMITGLDLVEWQLRIAAGEPLTLHQAEIQENGHAIEARLYAENPQNNFMPSAGTLRCFQLPSEKLPTVRVDSGFQQNDVVSIYYDPLLAKLISWGKDRATAIRIMQNMLNDTAVVGIHTNWILLNRLFQHSQFIQGDITTHFIGQHQTELLRTAQEPAVAIIAAACVAILQQQQRDLQKCQQQSRDSFSPWFIHDNWRLFQPENVKMTLWQQEKSWVILLSTIDISSFSSDTAPSLREAQRRSNPENHTSSPGLSPPHFALSRNNLKCHAQLSWDNQNLTVAAAWHDEHHFILQINNREIPVIIFFDENQLTVFCDAEQSTFSLQNPTAGTAQTQATQGIQAPMPGRIVEVFVRSGQTVAPGERLLVMEAMKMEHSLTAPRAGKIQEIFFRPGDRVKEGTPLLNYEEETT
jgi:3-methylcrotonyl-CoA carboxylase alpha subunit